MINKENRLKIAYRWFDKACKGGNTIGCYYIYLLNFYSFAGAHKKEALALAKKACDEGYIKGCRHESNDVIIFKRACDSELCTGCRLFSIALINGFNAIKDEKWGITLEIKACKLGSIDSCLLRIYDKMVKKRVDDDNLKEMLERLCDFGRFFACLILENHYSEKNNTTYSRGKARYYRERSRKHDPVIGAKATKVDRRKSD